MSVSVLNTDSGISGKTIDLLESDQTVTGLKTFDRDPSAPFAVSANSAVVTNLDADKLDGQEGSYYLDPANLSGSWTTPTFAAGNFTGSSSMTWTVGAGDVTTYAYKIIGKTMIVAFDIRTSTVGGTPNTALQIAIPSSKVATKTITSWCVVSDNGGTRTTGLCQVAASGVIISVFKDVVTTNNWTAATDTTSVQGTITFEIN